MKGFYKTTLLLVVGVNIFTYETANTMMEKKMIEAEEGRYSQLHLAALNNDEDEIKKLLILGADIEVRTRYGSTPLHVAFWNNNEKAVKVLLDMGANKEAIDERGDTPLNLAIFNRCSTEVVRLLLKNRANIPNGDKTQSEFSSDPAELEGGKSEDSTANGYKDAKADDERTPTVASEGQTEVVKVLLVAGADKDAKDEDTPLHFTTSRGDTTPAILLAKDKFGFTPFHHAVVYGNPEIIKVFIGAGVNVNVVDTTILSHFIGYTPLHFAAMNDHTEVVKILLAAGANRDATGEGGWNTPYFEARSAGLRRLLAPTVKG
ncbi:MAG: ankyrin repeat domain-containing protein [Holosporales bacterium]|jgi:ankyrin repeat protein|nr:ankyrin repeat domain-containing protein [Holosporales bacterium]